MSYDLTPPLARSDAYGVARHEEAGKFKARLRTANKPAAKAALESTNVFERATVAGKNYKKRLDDALAVEWNKIFSKFKPLSVGKSAYGDAYTVVVDANVLDFLKLAADKGTHRVRGQTVPEEGEKIVVKLVKRQKGTEFAAFIMENVTEATSHERMASDCFRIPCGPGARHCATDHIPRFYFAYLATANVYATFMSMAGSTSLASYLKSTRKKLDAEMYASIEKAVAVLWASGFTHADLHSGNIMVDPTAKRAWVIDFGFAVRLPQTLRDFVRQRIGDIVADGGSRSLGEIWSEKAPDGESLSSFTDKATQLKGISGWYNPNGRAVLLHYKKMTKAERTKFQLVRKRLWGCDATNDSELEEGEIRPPSARPPSARPPSARPPSSRPPSARPPSARPPSARPPYDACAEKCRALGKFCNPKTLRCVKKKPESAAAVDAYELCRRKCEALGKTCNPKTMRCVKAPAAAAGGPPVSPRPETARDLSAIGKRLKRVPKGGIEKYLKDKREKCRAEGKKFNPLTGRCIKK
jgi:serine/threonine protein kinase